MQTVSDGQNKKKVWLYSGLLLAGLLFGFVMLQNLAREFAPYTWKKTPCTIRKAEIVRPEPESQHYIFSVSYDYDFEGNRFNNTTWRRRVDLEPYDSYSALTDQAGKYFLEPNAQCYVNSNDPVQAVLHRENPVRLLLLVIPLVPIFLAGHGLLRLRRSSLRRQEPARTTVRFALQLIALSVVAFGLFLFFIFFVRGAFNLIRAASWKPATCTVIRSYLYTDQTSTTGSGSTNRRPGSRLRILFFYIYGGKEFRADRYDFVRWGTSGNKQATILQQYPAEAQVPCYINAAKPYEAVLNRRFTLRYLLGLLPLLIAAAGIVLFFAARRN
jgi:hypothetical protein